MRRLLLMVLILLVALVPIVWWQRAPLLGWYYLRNLAQASEQERALWVERVASLEADAVPGLIAHLKRNDVKVCVNAEAALAALAKRWGTDHAQTAALAEDLTSAFSALSTSGREAVLEWYLEILREVDPANKPLTQTAGKLLVMAAHQSEKGVYLRTLTLAEVMLARIHPEKADLYRELALRGLAAQDTDIRVHAVRLAIHPPLQADADLLDRVIPLLKDPAAEVRRAALLAVGLADKQLTVDDMLPLLQDADAGVRRLCEEALRVRGLQDNHIKLAKLITDPRPGERLQVVHYLPETDDLVKPGVWLLRLSQDPSPAVRAAAVRFAAEDPTAVDFRERLQQMAVEDPSPTVQQLAQFYLKTLPN